MRGILRFIGGAWLVLVGVPVLVGVTWAVGLTSAALSEGFFPTLADEVVAKVPALVEKGFAAAQQPGAIEDPETRAWVAAVAQAQPPLPVVLEQSGVNAWLQGSLAPSLRQVGQVVAGAAPAESPTVDLRPLRAAVTSPVVERWGRAVLAHLPPCDAAQLDAWRARALTGARGERPPPACHPGEEVVTRAFAALHARAAALPAEVPLFRADAPPPSIDWLPRSRALLWLLFAVPLVVIVIGAGLAGRGGRGFLAWCGGTTLAGGLVAAFLAYVAGGWFVPLLPWDAVRWESGPQAALWSSEAGRIFAAEAVDMAADVLDPLFAGVRPLALTVAGVGLAVALLALLVRPRTA